MIDIAPGEYSHRFTLTPDEDYDRCPANLPSQLIAGEIARITPGDNSRLRDEPSLDGEHLQSIQSGMPIEVLSGPVCADGYTWWEIVYNNGADENKENNRYWIAEVGHAEPYFVEPLNNPEDDHDWTLIPISSAVEINIAYERFENGHMFWVQPVDSIWVLTGIESGGWRIYRDEFIDTSPLTAISAPAGLLAPERGFGFVWRQYSQVQDQLGWAIAPEVGARITYEYHPSNGAHILTDPSGTRYILAPNGTWWSEPPTE